MSLYFGCLLWLYAGTRFRVLSMGILCFDLGAGVFKASMMPKEFRLGCGVPCHLYSCKSEGDLVRNRVHVPISCLLNPKP